MQPCRYCGMLRCVCMRLLNVYLNICVRIQECARCVGVYVHVCIASAVRGPVVSGAFVWLKLIAFELAAKILEARGKSRSTTFVQRVKRNFQSAHNGVFPPLAIFAGQLKRNQLYVCNV